MEMMEETHCTTMEEGPSNKEGSKAKRMEKFKTQASVGVPGGSFSICYHGRFKMHKKPF